MIKNTGVKGANDELQKAFLRESLILHNEELDIVEQNIMDQMRLEGPNAEFIHCLIGERENIKYKLKELHPKVYGG